MNYQVILPLEAQKDLRKLPKSEARHVAVKIKLILEKNPWPQGKNPKKLHGSKDYRLRIGNYRALYEIQDDQVTVFAIGNRKDIYRRFRL